MKQNSKEDIIKKWAPILENIGLTGSKDDWLSEYHETHSKNEIDNYKSKEFLSLLPISMKVAAKTIGQDLVSVLPMSGSVGMSKEEREKIEAEIKQKNRDGKIDSLIVGTEYKEEKVEQHPDYKSGSSDQLFYMDYVYNSPTRKKTRRAGKKNKKKNGNL